MKILSLLLPAAFMSLALPAQTGAPIKKVADTKAPPIALKNFKESGSAAAKVKVEVYTDYECPACRQLYLETLPSLVREYVQTNKIMLVHRDFPLPQHKYTRVATRYANAAGQIGKYDVVANQLFVTQPEWSQSGNVDAQIAKVLAPGDLVKVRDMVANDSKLDDTVAVDQAMGNQDRLNQTPTLVIVGKNGKRDVIGGAVPFGVLKSYLDKKLAE
jgi:protein-disulfide isomerase